MAQTVMLNTRIDATLKNRGVQVLERNGLSVTEYVRRSFEVLVEQQDIPQAMKDPQESRYDKRRVLLRSFAGCAVPALAAGENTDEDFDPLALRHARADEKYKEYIV